MTTALRSIPQRHTTAVATLKRLCAAASLLAVLTSAAPVAGQSQARDALDATQRDANKAPGPRIVPPRVLPVPTDLDPATQPLVAAPYSSFWNLNAPDAAAWRSTLAERSRAMAPAVAAMREALGVSSKQITLGSVNAYLIEPEAIAPAHEDRIIFQIHGGGFVFGAGEPGTHEAILMASYGGYRVIAVDYRMPPDAPYPAALDDLVMAWREVIKTHAPRNIAIEGTSAGGGLALSLVMRLRQEGLPLPAAMAPGSPWSDLSETGDSYQTNEWIDNVLVSYHGWLAASAKLYAGEHDLKDPMLSPVYGSFCGLPPALFTSGTRDLFLSNTVRAQRKLREAGVPAELAVYEGLSHAQYLDYHSPVSREVFQEIAAFFDRYLGHNTLNRRHRPSGTAGCRQAAWTNSTASRPDAISAITTSARFRTSQAGRVPLFQASFDAKRHLVPLPNQTYRSPDTTKLAE